MLMHTRILNFDFIVGAHTSYLLVEMLLNLLDFAADKDLVLGPFCDVDANLLGSENDN